MKIRCEQNSLRFRLRKSELVQLRAEQWLEMCLHFPDGQALCWELVLAPVAQNWESVFSEGRISVSVPLDIALHWMDTEEVGIENFLPLGNGAALHILIEKDFPCKELPGMDQSDFFVELKGDLPANC